MCIRDRYETGRQAALESHQALCALLEAIPAAEFGRDQGVRFRGYNVTIPRLLASESGDELILSLIHISEPTRPY